MRLGLNLRVSLIVVPLVAAMLALALAPIRSYLGLRAALENVRRELSCILLLCRFDIQAVRQSVEYLDVAFMGEDSRELEEVTAGARQTLGLLRQWEPEGEEAEHLDRIGEAHARLTAAGERAIELAQRGQHKAAAELFTQKIEKFRDRELLPLVDSALIAGSLALGTAIDNLLATSAQLALVPPVGVESDAAGLRAQAAEAISAAKFARQAQRVWGECRCFTFLGDPWDEMAVAESQFEDAFQLWAAQVAAGRAKGGAMTPAAMAEIGSRYHRVRQLTTRLADLGPGAARREIIHIWESEFEPLGDNSLPRVLESAFESYDAQIASLLDSIAMRSRVTGRAIGAVALLAFALALLCPWLISKWIVQPVHALTRAAQELGAGEGCHPARVRAGSEIAELAATFNWMEQQLQERNRELEAERARERLRHAERLASVGTLASGLAHQINNPVNNILLTAEHALGEEGPHAARMWRDALVASAEEARRCERIVRGLVAFARGEPGEKWTEDANQVVRRACDLTAACAAQHRASVELHLSEESVPILASPIALEEALVNIIQNAIESRPQAQVQLRTERRGETARIQVRDDGHGMGRETIRHLFDPFFTTREAEGGTGLGLSVAHRIIADHDGAISVDSRPGEGTIVSVDLPLAPAGTRNS